MFHQFLMQLLGSFVKWVSQMLASWLTGIRASTSTGGGGIFGSILGGIFGPGGGGSGGVLGTALGVGGMVAPALAMAGGGAGGALGGISTLPGSVFAASNARMIGAAIPAATGGASSGLLGKFAFGGFQSIAPMLAGGLALGGIGLIGAGGPVKGAIGGAMAGYAASMGLTALSASTPALLGLTLIPGFGWIAAGVGALIGGIIGLFTGGKKKKQANALEAQYAKAAKDLLDQYTQHQLDYTSALDQMQQVLATGQAALWNSGTGKYGGQAAATLGAVVAADLDKIEQLEKQRAARTAALGAMSVPEFAVGGYFGSGLNGGSLAVLHPGEFVMRKAAVDSLGVDFLAALNRAPRFAEGGAVSGGRSIVQNIELNLNVQAIDGNSVAQFFRRGRSYIVKEIRAAAWEGAF